MKARLGWLLACWAVLSAAASSAWSQPVRLDDSASPRAQVHADLARAQALDASTLRLPVGRVDYRLATAAYAGQRARIFYVVPMHVPGLRAPDGLVVRWRGTQFGPGTASPGQRVPVWTGRVPGPWMNETLDLEFTLDLRYWRLAPGQSISFESYFEIETLP